jgi:hypothetical protein
LMAGLGTVMVMVIMISLDTVCSHYVPCFSRELQGKMRTRVGSH